MDPDPFQTLGLPARFDLDPADIRKAYLRRAGQLHPDRADAIDEEQAARLNHASRTLSDPERRADALLLRLGGPSREQERTLPDGFLPEIMQIREQVEEAVTSNDPEAVAKWEDWAEQRRRRHIDTVSALFRDAGAPPDPPDAETLRQIRIELNAWRYIERLLEQIDPDAAPEPPPN